MIDLWCDEIENSSPQHHAICEVECKFPSFVLRYDSANIGRNSESQSDVVFKVNLLVVEQTNMACRLYVAQASCV